MEVRWISGLRGLSPLRKFEGAECPQDNRLTSVGRSLGSALKVLKYPVSILETLQIGHTLFSTNFFDFCI